MELDLIIALPECHTRTWYTARYQDNYTVHLLGVKPGDALASLICACCFAAFHKRLIHALTLNNCMAYAALLQYWLFLP